MSRHTINAIKDAEVHQEPWLHCYVPNAFPALLYKEMLGNLPTLDQMVPLNRKNQRHVYWLEQHGRRPVVARFWAEFREELFDNMWEALEDKIRAVGKSMGGELLHDIPGYRLGPHTDTTDKLITCLFYLPRSDEDARSGTALFKCDTPDPRGKGHKFTPEFELVKTIPYKPNTAFFFQRSNMSYHGVLPTQVERWLMAVDVFHEGEC